MTIFETKWFCHEVPRQFFGTETKCLNIIIYTKYLIILCVCTITYGALITNKLVQDPFPFFKDKFQQLIVHIKQNITKEI